nr:DUF1127 domain-containing protein [Paracoccus saliphilus]
MAMMDTNRISAAPGLGTLLVRLFSAIASFWDARVTRRELSRLSDRELDDIGLCRGDIDQAARN